MLFYVLKVENNVAISESKNKLPEELSGSGSICGKKWTNNVSGQNTSIQTHSRFQKLQSPVSKIELLRIEFD